MVPLTGQRLSSPQVRDFAERLDIFRTRCKLAASNNPAAKAMVDDTTVSNLIDGLGMTSIHQACAASSSCICLCHATPFLPAFFYPNMACRFLGLADFLQAYIEEEEVHVLSSSACVCDPPSIHILYMIMT